MENQKSAETLKTRKFLMVLPLLVLPFVSMAFWALGGGKDSHINNLPGPKQGFNTELPEAKFDVNEKQDKFSIYEASAKEHKDETRSDEAYNPLAFSTSNESITDPNEQKINERLSLINAEMNRQNSSESSYAPTKIEKSRHSENMSNDVNRLENLMENLNNGAGDEMEMTKLNAVLEKILDIQHPDRAKEKMTNKQSDKSNNAFAVRLIDGNENENLLALTSNVNDQAVTGNAIQATVHQDQDIVSGAVVKLRLLDSITVHGILIGYTNKFDPLSPILN